MKPRTTTSPAARRTVTALKERGPMFADELCVAACIARNTFDGLRRVLEDAGLMHVCGHAKSRAGLPKARYAHGPGESVVRPKGGVPGVSLASESIQRAIAVLECANDVLRCDEIAARAGMSVKYFKCVIRPVLLKMQKMHLSGWTLYGTVYSPLYLAGPTTEKEPPRPARMDARLVKQRYKFRKMAAQSIQRPPDPALAAMLGLGIQP